MNDKEKIKYIVFNDCTLLNRGEDSSWSDRKKALRRIKRLIKNYLNEWRKGEDCKYKSDKDKYLWSLICSEMSFKKLDIIYEITEDIYNIDLKSMIYIEKHNKKTRYNIA